MRVATSRRLLLGYAVGSLGTGVYLTVPSVLLLYFMTDILGIASAMAAIAIVAPKVLGAMLDPAIGWLSDNSRTRWGRRRPWMLAGALGLGATFIVLFHVPSLDAATSRFAYILAVYIGSAIFYSLFATPYIAMPAEMSDAPEERTRIMAWRMSFVMGGVILGSAVAPMLVSWFGGGRVGYGAMSLIVGTACAAAMLTSVAATASAPILPTTSGSRPLWTDMGALLRDRAFIRLSSVFVLQTALFGLVSALLPYVARRLLGGDEALVGTLLLILLVFALICMRPWAALAGRWGHRRCLIAASGLHGLFSLTLLGLGPGYPIALLALQFAALGTVYAGLQLIPFAMLTDVIERDRLTTGLAREGIYSGLWTSFEKLGLATGPALAAILLSALHYQPTATASDAVMVAIRYVIVFGPAAVQALSIMLLFGYPAAPTTAADASRRANTGGR